MTSSRAESDRSKNGLAVDHKIASEIYEGKEGIYEKLIGTHLFRPKFVMVCATAPILVQTKRRLAGALFNSISLGDVPCVSETLKPIASRRLISAPVDSLLVLLQSLNGTDDFCNLWNALTAFGVGFDPT